ncbi:hypothetical protein HOLleu_38231 [Holothuria leucospilota]|uniref:Uncharacterized protein n=1 Tax=Holothuria leucospilota TaxID=206669 RepID=A0A9Q1BDZ6_HOLLE|nr:hypothetical protein HOLleu_38231 [Holothuria leucospilota]
MGERNLSRGFLGCPTLHLGHCTCVHFDSSAVGTWHNVFFKFSQITTHAYISDFKKL